MAICLLLQKWILMSRARSQGVRVNMTASVEVKIYQNSSVDNVYLSRFAASPLLNAPSLVISIIDLPTYNSYNLTHPINYTSRIR